MSYTTDQIRNIALAGQASAGKTTLFEALLHAGGAIQTAGSVERGTTVSDHDPLEKERKHSLGTSIASIDSGDAHINLIDTPGSPDFRGPTLSALAAVETCAIVIDAAIGIAHQTRRLMDRAKQRNLCRILVVNKIDHEGIDVEGIVEALRDEFGNECLPINLPAKNGSTVVDCFFQPSGESDFSSVGDAHQHIIDQVVEINETRHGALPRRRRIRLVGSGTARRIRAMPARRPSRPDLLHLRTHRRRRQGIAGAGSQAVAESEGRQSAAVRQGQRRECAAD